MVDKNLNGLGHYIIGPGAMGQLLVMTTNLTNPGYTYANRRIKKPPDILGIIQRLTHPPDPIGRHRTPSHPMELSVTNTQ